MIFHIENFILDQLTLSGPLTDNKYFGLILGSRGALGLGATAKNMNLNYLRMTVSFDPSLSRNISPYL